MLGIRIVGPVSERAANLEVSPWVSYMLDDATPIDRFWFAIDGSGVAVGGIKLALRMGSTARDIVGDSVMIDELSVDPDYLRQGIASALVRAAEDWVKAQPGLPNTMGLGVEADNAAAIELYRKLGYVVAELGAEAVTFSGTDGKLCWVMFKLLDSEPK